MIGLKPLLELLREKQVKLWAEGGSLRYQAPRGALTLELLDALRQHKPTLLTELALLERLPPPPQTPPQPPPQTLPQPPPQTPPQTPRGSASAVSAEQPGRPLSFAQERLWLQHQLEGQKGLWNVVGHFLLTGPLNVQSLEQALNRVVERHAILRTSFHFRASTVPGDAPGLEQRVTPYQPFSLDVEQVSRGPRQSLVEAIHPVVLEEQQLSFDLSTGRLYRFRLLKLIQRPIQRPIQPTADAQAELQHEVEPEVQSEVQHVLMLTFHHIAVDEWSIRVLFEELSQHYSAAPVPPLPLQYGDVALEERAWLASPDGQHLEQEWLQRLKGLTLSTVSTGVPSVSGSGNSTLADPPEGLVLEAVLPSHVGPALKSCCARHGVTPFIAVSAAVSALRFCLGSKPLERRDIVLGMDLLNREEARYFPLLGCFTNQLPMRVWLEPGMSIEQVIEQQREAFLFAQAGQRMPYQRLVSRLAPPGQAGQVQLFDLKVSLLEAQGLRLQLPMLTVEALPLPLLRAREGLGILFTEQADGWHLQLNAQRRLHSLQALQQLQVGLVTILQEGLTTPTQTLEALHEGLQTALRAQQATQAEARAASAVQKLKARKRESIVLSPAQES